MKWLVNALVICLGLLVALPAFAESEFDIYKREIEQRRSTLEEISEQLASRTDHDLQDLRSQVRNIREDSQIARMPFQERLLALKSDQEALGLPPAEGAPAESPDIAQERARLAAEIALYDAAVRQAELNMSVASRLLKAISERRRDEFYGQILQEGLSPADPRVWQPAVSAFLSGVSTSLDWLGAWFEQRGSRGAGLGDFASILAAFLIAVLFFVPMRRWLGNKTSEVMELAEPTATSRGVAAAARMLARALPGVIAGSVIYAVMVRVGLIADEGQPLASTVWLSFLAVLAVDGAATAIFLQDPAKWRVIPLKRTRGHLARGLLTLSAIVLGVDAVLAAWAPLVGTSQEMTLAQSALVATVLAVLIFLLSRKNLWILHETAQDRNYLLSETGWTNVRIIGLAVSVLTILAALSGYVALAYFAATRLFYLAGLFGVAWCVRGLLHEAIKTLDRRVAGVPSEQSVDPEQQSIAGLIAFWVGLITDILILMVFTPLAFLIFGAAPTEVRDWALDLFFGFEVGAITISIADILSGVLLFVIILAITRFIQRFARTKLLPKMRVDPGVQNSLLTLIGYVGFIVAVLIAVGTVGVNLSNLAIVAGALSVGIGFGLQSIVNNFVSGLILLFERPVKVGDWIVVPSGQGYVKQISVRSTEIETFDRASVIVPNSELVTSAVTNWTHTDKIGRIILPIGVSYKCDPEKVIDILEGVIADNSQIRRSPEPFVYFAGFGDSSLNFEVRVFISDVSNLIRVQNALRIAIFKRFQEEGIEIPFPQRVVHMEDHKEKTS